MTIHSTQYLAMNNEGAKNIKFGNRKPIPAHHPATKCIELRSIKWCTLVWSSNGEGCKKQEERALTIVAKEEEGALS